MINEKHDDMLKVSSYIKNNMIDEYLDLDSSEKDLLNAVDRYLKLNFHELYNKNNLEVIFKKAREDEEIKGRIYNIINNFIFN